MDEEKRNVSIPANPSSSVPPAPSSAPLAVAEKKAPAAAVPRQMFSVELKPGETNIVSWKRLLKNAEVKSARTAAPTGAHPALESRIAPASPAPAESDLKDGQPPSNRFSAVIEKIERLYTGKESSDEELDDLPDDDQYDTEDSFIDDTELNEYFKVDKSSTKHNGFFVNRGKLERIEPSSPPNLAPMKRRRKDPTVKDGDQPGEYVNASNMRMKAAARSAALVGKKSPTSSNFLAPAVDRGHEGKLIKNKLSTSKGILKKCSTIDLERSSSLKMPSKVLALPAYTEDFEKKKPGIAQHIDFGNKPKHFGESFDNTREVGHEKALSLRAESQPKFFNGENDLKKSNKIQRRKRNGTIELPDLNSPWSMQPTETSRAPKRLKEGSVVRPKGTTLERAIRDLEKIVTEYKSSKPPNLDVRETDSSQVVRKRLPTEIKQKLAKVARLANSQGKISSEQFLNHLMDILGHLVQPKALKRHLKEMVELGLSAKQAKADRFQQIKKEMIEMIKTRVVTSKVKSQQDGSSDDFQELPTGERALKARGNIDHAIEDKICDLYDLYVEGMDEDKGPQSRKLYVELAELWPAGYMDNLGIKDAVYRAKERKKVLHTQCQVQDEERIKRKRLSSAIRIEESVRSSGKSLAGQDRPAVDSTGQIPGSSDRMVSSQGPSSSGRISDSNPSSNGSSHHHSSKNHDKVGGGSSADVADEGNRAFTTLNREGKSESQSLLVRAHPTNHRPHLGKEKDISHEHGPIASEIHLQKSSPQSAGLPGSEQPS